MIVASFEKNRIAMSGHAGYAKAGSDIVCAGTSALFYCMLQSILNLTEDKVEYCIGPGDCEVVFENLSESGKLLIDSFFTGMNMLAEQYPEHVQIR